MVNIGNRPILWHIMKIYSEYGFKDFVLSLGYKGEMIKEYFCHYELINNDVTIELGHPEKLSIHQSHNEKDWRITLADTGEKALKGARLKKVEKYVSGNEFMLTYGDGLADININSLLAFHRKHGKVATVTGISSASRFGELLIDGDRVMAFREKPRVSSGYINGGFFVFNRDIFEYLTADDSCDLETDTMEMIARKRTTHGLQASWILGLYGYFERCGLSE